MEIFIDLKILYIHFSVPPVSSFIIKWTRGSVIIASTPVSGFDASSMLVSIMFFSRIA